jgi:hypothetical protein
MYLDFGGVEIQNPKKIDTVIMNLEKEWYVNKVANDYRESLATSIKLQLSTSQSIQLEAKRAAKLNISTSKYAAQLEASNNLIKESLDKLESKLSDAESKGSSKNIKEWEEQLLHLHNQYGKIEGIAPIASRKAENNDRQQLLRSITPYHDSPEGIVDAAPLNSSEHMMMHTRIISDQDSQLDALTSVITRQKNIGIAITNELDTQVFKSL